MAKLTRLKDVRQRKALTQQQLAERAGVNRVTIARIEGGKDEPFPATLRKVADALGVEPEDLLAPAAEWAADRAPMHKPGPSDAGASDAGSATGSSTDIALDGRITLVNASDVHRFLSAHADLAPLINEAADQLVRYVPDAQVSLEVLVDPEYGDEHLFLGAATRLQGLEALAALDQFDDGWWLANSRQAHNLLVIDVR